MTSQKMASQKDTGTSDPTYNLVSVLYHALQGAETYTQYIRDAEQANDQVILSADAARGKAEIGERTRAAGEAVEALVIRMGPGARRPRPSM